MEPVKNLPAEEIQKKNHVKWRLIFDEHTNCDCGKVQITIYLINCSGCLTSCAIDIMLATKDEIAKFWQDRI